MESVEGRAAAMMEQLIQAIIDERIDSGEIDLETMSFAEIEQMGHELGRRLASGFDHRLTGRQSDLWSEDWCCPTCGLECEAVRHPRTVQTVDGPAEVVEIKSICPRCRRSFFPQAGRLGPLRRDL